MDAKFEWTLQNLTKINAVDFNNADCTMKTALAYACRHSTSVKRIARLIEWGADPKEVGLLNWALGNRKAGAEIVKVLLAAGADANKGIGKVSVLASAMSHGYEDVVDALLQAGAELFEGDFDDLWTPPGCWGAGRDIVFRIGLTNFQAFTATPITRRFIARASPCSSWRTSRRRTRNLWV